MVDFDNAISEFRKLGIMDDGDLFMALDDLDRFKSQKARERFIGVLDFLALLDEALDEDVIIHDDFMMSFDDPYCCIEVPVTGADFQSVQFRECVKRADRFISYAIDDERIIIGFKFNMR